MEELLKLYRSMLLYFDCDEDPDGYVVSTFRKEKERLKVSDKYLVLPYTRYLDEPSVERIVFHPMYPEDFTKGPSPVVEVLKDNLTDRLNTNMFALLMIIINMAKNPKLVKKQDVDAKELASTLGGDVTKATLDKFNKLIKAAAGDQEKTSSFIRFFMRQGKSINNVRYSRVCIASFPFYNLLTEDKPVMLGIEISREEKATFRKLLEYLIPNIDKQDTYSQGSDSKQRPYMESLVRSTSMIVSISNHTAVTLKELLGDGLKDYLINTDFCSINLSEQSPTWYILPAQSGNAGAAKVTTGGAKEAEFVLPDRGSLAAPRKLAGALDSEEDRNRREERRSSRNEPERTDPRKSGNPLAQALAGAVDSRNHVNNRGGRGLRGGRGNYRDDRYDRDRRDDRDRYYDRGGRSDRGGYRDDYV